MIPTLLYFSLFLCGYRLILNSLKDVTANILRCPGGYDPMSPVRSSSDSDSGANFRGYCAAVLAAAGCGNFLASFLRPPYEIVKQRLQV